MLRLSRREGLLLFACINTGIETGEDALTTNF